MGWRMVKCTCETRPMQRIAGPMVGGVVASMLMELMVYPAISTIWKWRWDVKPARTRAASFAQGNHRAKIS
jgi:hypothetical protein